MAAENDAKKTAQQKTAPLTPADVLEAVAKARAEGMRITLHSGTTPDATRTTITPIGRSVNVIASGLMTVLGGLNVIDDDTHLTVVDMDGYTCGTIDVPHFAYLTMSR